VRAILGDRPFASEPPLGPVQPAARPLRGAPLKVEYAEESSVKKSLSFEVEPDLVDAEIAERSKHYANRVKLPGFRPGKVPAHVIRQRFKAQVLEDVAEKMVNKLVHDELEGRGLRPVATPRVTELKIDENTPLTFKAVFEILPLVELPEYKGLPITTREPRVADEDVDKEIEKMREEAARYDPIEGRPAQDGDFVVLDVAFSKEDGTAGKRDENVLVEVGSKDNHKDLNEALVGLSPGDKKDVSLVYGDDYEQENLRGQTVRYAVAVKGVKTKVVPAADDEFAKDLGEFGSLAELRDKVRGQMVAAEERKIEREVKNALVEALVQRASFEVPDALVERHMIARTENAARGLALQGLDPAKVGVDWEKYRDAQREESVKAAKADILLDEIARREGIEALENEVDAEVGRYAERVKKAKDVVRARLEKDGDLGPLKARIREEKTLDLLKANARMNVE
jgi:trigger factor